MSALKDYSHLLGVKKVAKAADQSVIDGLKRCIAATYMLDAVGRASHWNVTGLLFFELHKAFGKIYEDTVGAIDDLAERIRELDEFIPVDPSQFQSQAQIAIPVPPQDCETWRKAVLAALEKVIAELRALEVAANDVQNLEVQDLALSQAQGWTMWRWQIRSTLL